MANLDQILDYTADNLAVYKSGDTLVLNNPYLFGAAGAAGTIFFCTAFTPKIIPDDLTITWSGNFTQIHTNNNIQKPAVPIDSIIKSGDNMLTIGGTSSGLGARALLNCVPNVTITFN